VTICLDCLLVVDLLRFRCRVSTRYFSLVVSVLITIIDIREITSKMITRIKFEMKIWREV